MRPKLIAGVILVMLVVLFAIKNATPTDFWFFATFRPNLSLLLLISFIVGIVVGLLFVRVGRRVEGKG